MTELNLTEVQSKLRNVIEHTGLEMEHSVTYSTKIPNPKITAKEI